MPSNVKAASMDTVPLLRNTLATSTMSTTTSPSEASSSLSTHARKIGFPKSDVHIHLDNHYKAKAYTSGSPLTGELTITTQRDVRFDNIEIILLGNSKTRTDGYNAPHESTHTFLKMAMPVPESLYPIPRVLENGTTTTIPFNFVLPSFLTLNACTHNIESDHVRVQHLCPPPSMGSWARGNWEKDDLAPQMAEVEYCIKARVWRLPEMQGRPVKVMEAIKPIQFLPAFAEDAPLSIAKKDMLYKTSKTKMIRKNLITGKMGKLTVAGQQPRAIMMQPDGQAATGTTVQLDLKFEPMSEDVQPPKITGLTSKITAHTYFSAGPISDLPNMGDFNRGGVPDRRGVYSKAVGLHTKLPEIVTWVTCQARRDSGYCSDTAQENTASEEDDCETEQQQRQRRKSTTLTNLVRPSKHQSPPHDPCTGPVYHATTLQLPIDIPAARKYFVPTFHSCITSRVYTLHVSLTVAYGPATSSTISLDLPIQVAVEAVGPNMNAADEGLPTFEDAVEDAAVDEFLQPRLLSVPQTPYQEMGVLPRYGPR